MYNSDLNPAVHRYRGAIASIDIPVELFHELKNLGNRQRTTLFMTLLAAFKSLLYIYTKQNDILIGIPVANRNREEIEGLVGLFQNMLVIRSHLTSGQTFQDILGRVRQAACDL